MVRELRRASLYPVDVSEIQILDDQNVNNEELLRSDAQRALLSQITDGNSVLADALRPVPGELQ